MLAFQADRTGSGNQLYEIGKHIFNPLLDKIFLYFCNFKFRGLDLLVFIFLLFIHHLPFSPNERGRNIWFFFSSSFKDINVY